jgi:YHS domain-containing protein
MDPLSRRNVVRALTVVFASWGFASADTSAAADKTPLAILGYDPVAYFTLGKPVPGSPEYEHEWDGHRYLFSLSEHRDLFKADPMRYAPQFPNFCANAMTRGEVVQADPRNFLISGGKLYMFGKATGPRLFQQGITENIEKANRNLTLMRNR